MRILDQNRRARRRPAARGDDGGADRPRAETMAAPCGARYSFIA
jgi:hypothetical protein